MYPHLMKLNYLAWRNEKRRGEKRKNLDPNYNSHAPGSLDNYRCYRWRSQRQIFRLSHDYDEHEANAGFPRKKLYRRFQRKWTH